MRTYAEELENRLLVFIKAYNLEDEAANGYEDREPKSTFFDSEREEIRLLKYALNDIHIDKKEEECILTITQRFKQKETSLQENRQSRASSWPKHPRSSDPDSESAGGRGRHRMEEREEEDNRH